MQPAHAFLLALPNAPANPRAASGAKSATAGSGAGVAFTKALMTSVACKTAVVQSAPVPAAIATKANASSGAGAIVANVIEDASPPAPVAKVAPQVAATALPATAVRTTVAASSTRGAGKGDRPAAGQNATITLAPVLIAPPHTVTALEIVPKSASQSAAPPQAAEKHSTSAQTATANGPPAAPTEVAAPINTQLIAMATQPVAAPIETLPLATPAPQAQTNAAVQPNPVPSLPPGAASPAPTSIPVESLPSASPGETTSWIPTTAPASAADKVASPISADSQHGAAATTTHAFDMTAPAPRNATPTEAAPAAGKNAVTKAGAKPQGSPAAAQDQPSVPEQPITTPTATVPPAAAAANKPTAHGAAAPPVAPAPVAASAAAQQPAPPPSLAPNAAGADVTAVPKAAQKSPDADVDAIPAPAAAADASAAPVATAAQTPAPAPATAPHAAPSAAPAAAVQVAQAVASVHVAAGAQGQVTIHLQPGELGAVQVRIERAADGTATVTVQVEKAATLQTMQLDISHLHQALDRAGVPSEQRQVTLHLAAPAASGGFGAGTGTGGGPGAGNSFSRGGQPQQQGRGQTAAPAAQTTSEDDIAPPRWVAAGINITA